jgi:hypothetical protein
MLVAEAEQVSRADHALSVRPTALPNQGAGGHLLEYSRFFFRNDDLSPDMSYEVLQDNSSRGSRRGLRVLSGGGTGSCSAESHQAPRDISEQEHAESNR